MAEPLVCMTLTGKTLDEDLRLIQKYHKQVDLVELRADCLNEDEQLYIKRFPSLCHLPSILTIRRNIDGGFFNGGEFSRTNLFARALAFANPDKRKNFSYVEFEDDYHVSSIQDAAIAFGVQMIRSYYSINENISNLKEKCDSLRRTGYEIPKVAFLPGNLTDVANVFKEGESITKYNHIISAIGLQGQPSRILSQKAGNYLTYVSSTELAPLSADLGLLDLESLLNVYSFRNLAKDTKLFGVSGWPLQKTQTIEMLNLGFRNRNHNAVSIPLRSPIISDILYFTDQLGFSGLSITEPLTEAILFYLSERSPEVDETGTCNTVVRRNNKFAGFNTNIEGFRLALKEFLGDTKIKRKKVAIIGAGGTAKTVAYILYLMGAKVCVFNRTLEHAQLLAERYNFQYAGLDAPSAELLREYSSLIIQTTPAGSDNTSEEAKFADPISFYNFTGNELLLDLIYTPSITPLMKRASLAGCRTANGKRMLEYSIKEQFKLFTGDSYIS